MKKSIKIMAILLLSGWSFGQQEAQYTQYLDNMLYYNPAYAGSRDMLNFTALHRQQWVGIDGAPMTTSFSMHSPLRYQSLGLGFSLLNDKVGPTNSTWLNGDVSYSLRFKKHKGRLSFGVKGGLNILNGDLAGLIKQDNADATLNVRYKNELKPNVGFGIYYHSTQWFVGLSSPRLIQTRLDAGGLYYVDQRHYYLTVGGYINASRMLKIRPSVMFKMTEHAPFALDGSLAFIFYDKLWLGANYRLKESVGAIVQFQLSNQFKIGYAYDLTTTRLMKYNGGSHELLLSYDLLFKQKSINSPRYF